MKKILPITFIALYGCTATVSSDETVEEPQTFSDLPICTKSNDGQMIYLPSDDERYLCEDKEWKLLNVVFSSSKGKDSGMEDDASSSSSQKQNSLSSGEESSDCEKGYICDSRDGKKYRTTTIGHQVWMAENLNYMVEESFCYDLANAYCEKYGRLYTWKAAMAVSSNDEKILEPHKGVCPTGWHVPSYNDFFEMTNFVKENNGGESVKWSLVSKSWNDVASDMFGFSVLPSGERWSSIGFKNRGENALFWSSTVDEKNGNYWGISYGSDFESDWQFDKGTAYSIRCVKD